MSDIEQRSEAALWAYRMSLADIQVIREDCAQLVEAMISEIPYKDKPWARCALLVAARAIRRGRHLTEQEKLANLIAAIAKAGGKE